VSIVNSASDSVVIIIQARYGSTRLPGKATLDLAGKPVLARVIDRCRHARNVDGVICATTFEPESPVILSICRDHGIDAVQGPTGDVLGRYLKAARTVDAGHIVRITSDCPLIDPDVIDDLVALYRARGVDYANNVEPRTYPHGLDCEIMSRTMLERAAHEACLSPHREHVTPWIREHPDLRRCYLRQDGRCLRDLRWTLDYPADLDFFRALFAADPTAADAPYPRIVEFLDRNPAINLLNAAHRMAW